MAEEVNDEEVNAEDRHWEVVLYVPIKCPKCESRSHIQYGRAGCTRYHKCRPCGLRYKSYEKREDKWL